MNELEGIPSIWDGWEKQCRGVGEDGDGRCAMYFVVGRPSRSSESIRRLFAVGRHIQSSIELPIVFGESFTPRAVPLHAIVYANDVLGWTPEQFRELDRRLEYEEGMRQIEQQIKEVRHDVSEVSA